MKTQEIITVPLSQLSHHPINQTMYSCSDIEILIANIEENGQLEPLTVDSQFRVISGNRRLVALQKLGIENAFVIVSEVDEEDIPYLIFSHNRQRVKNIRETLAEIKVLEEYYSVGRGSRKHLKTQGKTDWLASAAKELHISESQLGKYVAIRNSESTIDLILNKGISLNRAHRLYLSQKKIDASLDLSKRIVQFDPEGNDVFRAICRSSNDMKELENESVKLIFTSPPFPLSIRDYGVKGIGCEPTVEEYVENLTSHLAEAVRVMKKDGTMWLNLGDVYVNKCLQNAPHRVVMKLVEKYGLIHRSTIIWKKSNPKPTGAIDRLGDKTEYIFMLTKSDKYTFNPVYVPTVSENSNPSAPKHHAGGESSINSEIVVLSHRYLESYWDENVITTAVETHGLNRILNIGHPAVFPPILSVIPILIGSDPDDLILDPFMGSGTTAQTALKLGRKFIGYDLNEKYVNKVRAAYKSGELIRQPICRIDADINSHKLEKRVLMAA